MRGGRPPHANPLRHTDARVYALRAFFRSVGLVAPGAAARVGEAVFCRPPGHPMRPGEEEFLRTGRAFRVPVDGRPIAAWTWGEGPAVLLMHGWGSRASRFRLFVPALLERGFRVVALDGPAHGWTSGTRASLPEFAAALAGVARATGAISGFVGHSLGGAAVLFAQGRLLPPAPTVILAAPADPASYFQRFARHLHLPRAVQARIRRSLEERLRLRWTDLDIPGIVARLDVPLLVIHDADDHDVPLADGTTLAGAARRGRLVRTTGLGHRAIMRDAGVVAQAADFLAEHARR
jgi:pimeloyl-ACP methyl ester carboxylesterase